MPSFIISMWGLLKFVFFLWSSLHERMCRTWGSNSGRLHAKRTRFRSSGLPRPAYANNRDNAYTIHQTPLFLCFFTCGITRKKERSFMSAFCYYFSLSLCKRGNKIHSSLSCFMPKFSSALRRELLFAFTALIIMIMISVTPQLRKFKPAQQGSDKLAS